MSRIWELEHHGSEVNNSNWLKVRTGAILWIRNWTALLEMLSLSQAAEQLLPDRNKWTLPAPLGCLSYTGSGWDT